MEQKMLDELRKPFNPSDVVWKPGAVKGDRALAMPYADLRAYMNRLDEVCGDEWSVAYEPWGPDRLICKLTIAGVSRSSTGETTNESEKSEIGGTVAEAQAFKRASAMFGLGRYLYNLPSGWADYDPAKRQFTVQAKAKLLGILTQHYRQATDRSPQQASVSPENDVLWEVEPEKKRATADQLAVIGKLGVKAYGDEYNSVKLAQWKSKGAVSSLDQLFESEAAALIKALNKKISDDAKAAQPQAEAVA